MSEELHRGRADAPFLPSVLTTEEFAYLVRYDPETVRCKIRKRQIKAFDRPARIPCRELLKFGVDLRGAAILLSQRSRQPIAA